MNKEVKKTVRRNFKEFLNNFFQISILRDECNSKLFKSTMNKSPFDAAGILVK